jgi:regulatory subunit for Cdc7p protein kinase
MNKKIWSLDKLQRMLQLLLEPDTHTSAAYGARNASARSQAGTYRPAEEQNLLQLLQLERLNGPSDRDPTVASRELTYFKGPYLYVYDMEEKQKPIMVREYPKVANKLDGEWPQFRSVTQGRCPFVEEVEPVARESRKQPAQEREKVAVNTEQVPTLQPPEVPAPKPVTGKRSLTEMQDAHNKARSGVNPTEIFNPPKSLGSKHADFRTQNFFTGRAGTGRLFAGEPVASGVQPSHITSAIRSQMISSTSGINGAKAGTSKEIHGLQRKVLQKSAPTSHDLSSRRLAEATPDVTSSRSVSLSRTTSRKLDLVEECSNNVETSGRTAAQVQAKPQPLKSKRDLKPGYCENCQDKFRDFDEVSNIHACSTFCLDTLELTSVNSISYHENIANSPKMMITGLNSMIFSCNLSVLPSTPLLMLTMRMNSGRLCSL